MKDSFQFSFIWVVGLGLFACRVHELHCEACALREKPSATQRTVADFFMIAALRAGCRADGAAPR
jgi:hypothetical protein